MFFCNRFMFLEVYFMKINPIRWKKNKICFVRDDGRKAKSSVIRMTSDNRILPGSIEKKQINLLSCCFTSKF